MEHSKLYYTKMISIKDVHRRLIQSKILKEMRKVRHDIADMNLMMLDSALW